MTINASFLELMPSTATVFTKSSRDAYGKVTFGATGTTFRCRVSDDRNVTSGADQRDVIETGTIYCYGNPTVTVDDKIVLPDNTVIKVTQVSVVDDESGPHHTIIRFGAG